jgi:hypothetical protein
MSGWLPTDSFGRISLSVSRMMFGKLKKAVVTDQAGIEAGRFALFSQTINPNRYPST